MDANNKTQWLYEETLTQLVEDTSPELLHQLAQLFIEEAKQREQAVVAGRQQQDWQRVREELHTLKSNAGMLGAYPLQRLCRAAELACRDGDHAVVDELLPQIRHAQHHTIQALQHRLKQA